MVVIRNCRIVRVIDGDSLLVDIVHSRRITETNVRVRLAGCDAKPLGTSEGDLAKLALESLAPPASLCTIDIGHERADLHGRLIANVFGPAGRNVVEDLIAQGAVDRVQYRELAMDEDEVGSNW